VLEVKVIDDATLSPTYLGSRSMKPLKKSPVQVPPSQFLQGKMTQPDVNQFFVVDSDTLSIHSKGEESVWNDERGIVALRKFYALCNEAENTVSESKNLDGNSVLHFCSSM